MSASLSFAIQVALMLIPVGVLLVVKRKIRSIPLRLCVAIALALGFAAMGYFLALRHGWRPVDTSGRVIPASPTVFFAMHAIGLSVALVVISLVKRRSKDERAS